MTDSSTATQKPPAAPAGLAAGGRRLWREVVRDHELDIVQRTQLTEACRMKDRLDRLDKVLSGDVDVWMSLVPMDLEGTELRLQVAGALGKANETANSMKQLLAALRLPDEASGKRPQRRGPRGAQAPTVPGGAPAVSAGTVSSMERHRQRAQTGT